MAWFDEPRTKVPGDIQAAGQLPSGDYKTLQLDANGNLKTTGGGGGGGDASAANQATQIAQIGEVQASPTANTVLDRLKSLATLLSGGLPAALTAGGGLKAGLVDSIPAGTNLIGKIAGDSASTASLSNVSSSASNVTILATNANRKRVVIVNDSTATLYLKFGATASATSYTYLLYGGDIYESPSFPVYTGQIDGIWASANGAARVTEFT